MMREFGAIVAEIEGMRAFSLRIDSLSQSGKDPGALPSVNKLWWPQTHQRLFDFALRAASELGLDASDWYRGWLDARPESIYGGSAQIQRNILSERALGLPRGGSS
jgi:alkylation response protein AidB-like acyl-CoA dehydrogenase